jgi:hypothetical protein
MATLLEFAAKSLKVVELTVNDYTQPFVLISERLIAGCQIDDAKASMAQTDKSIGCNPLPLPIWSAVLQALRRVS